MLLDVTYLCKEWNDETGRWEEGENACRLRVHENRATIQPDGRVKLDPREWVWLGQAIDAVERLQDREYLPGSIRDIQLAKKEG